jgi:hypothetical protein
MHVSISHLITLHAQAWANLSTTYTLAKFQKNDNVEVLVELVLDCSNDTCYFEGSWHKMKIERATEFEDTVWIWE